MVAVCDPRIFTFSGECEGMKLSENWSVRLRESESERERWPRRGPIWCTQVEFYLIGRFKRHFIG